LNSDEVTELFVENCSFTFPSFHESIVMTIY